MGYLPCQVLIPSPSFRKIEKPLLIEWEIYERRMQQVREVLNGPIIEDDDHFFPFCNTLSHGCHISP